MMPGSDVGVADAGDATPTTDYGASRAASMSFVSDSGVAVGA